MCYTKAMTKKVVIAFFIVLFIALQLPTEKAAAGFDCLTLSTNSTTDQKAQCQSELDQLNQQLIELTGQLNDQKKQTGTINGDITYLTNQINTLKTKIKSRALAISNLKVSIDDKSKKIVTLQQKIEKEHGSLAQLLRNTNEFDNQNITNWRLLFFAGD